MFVFENMRVQLGDPLLSPNDKKYLRISIGIEVQHTQRPAIILDERKMQWPDAIQIPHFESQDYLFEIYNHHRFGYDETELSTVFSGKFQAISHAKSRNSLQIFDYQHRMIGYLKADIRLTTQNQQQNTLSSQLVSKLQNYNQRLERQSKMPNKTSWPLVHDRTQRYSANIKAQIQAAHMKAKRGITNIKAQRQSTNIKSQRQYSNIDASKRQSIKIKASDQSTNDQVQGLQIIQKHQILGQSKVDQGIGQYRNKQFQGLPANYSVLESNMERGGDQNLRVNQIVARFPSSRLKKGFVMIQIGDQRIQTQTVRIRSGQLIFIQPQEINYSKEETEARIEVHAVDSDDQQLVVAEGTLMLISPKPPRKVNLNKDGFEIGEMLAESIITDRNQLKRISQLIDQQRSVMQKRRKAKFSSLSREVQGSQLEQIKIQPQTSRTQLNSAIHTLSLSSKPKKDMSKAQGKLPRQKRFSVKLDEGSGSISYLRQRSMDFREYKSGKFYKGASFGYGNKVDFTKNSKQNPGVGKYKLPTIWDRY